MIRIIFCILFSLLSLSLCAQDDDEETVRTKSYPGGKCYMMRLYLKDKHGTTGALNSPQTFLSQKAIKRRHDQRCQIDSTDLPVSSEYLKLLNAENVEIITKSKWNNSVVIKDKSLRHLKFLAKMPFVRDSRIVWYSPDSIKVARHSRSHFQESFKAWETVEPNIFGTSNDQIQMIGAQDFYEKGLRGHGMAIAVLDGGFMNVDKIPAFRETKIAMTADFVYPQCKSIFAETDHGTKVLSTMAANLPNLYMGTAPDATFILIRCEDTQTENLVEEDYWAAAAEFADSAGVDILTSSLGYHHFDSEEMNYRYKDLDGHTSLISNTASMMAQKGIVMVCSAGNDGMSSWKKINMPADADNIITVGAVTTDGVNAAFSSVGPTADGRVKPDVMACGSPAAVITGRGTLLRDIGTSFAAPQIAGAIACYWQQHPKMTAFEVIENVRHMGNNYDTPDNIYGYGIPQF